MMKEQKGIADFWFYFPIAALVIYFIIRLINQSQMITTFPLDYTNDIPCYLAFLHWFHVYGFHGLVPNWLNGIILFDVYPPGWVFFVYPIYLLTKNVLATAYISLIVQYALGAVIFYFLGKSMNLSKIKALAFYCIFFVSPMAVGDFIKQGRQPEMLAWLLFIALAGVIMHYRNKELNINFLWCAPLFAGLVLTHQAETILLSIIVLGLVLTHWKLKEISIIAATFIAGLAASAFWWVPFLKRSIETTVVQYGAVYGQWLLDFTKGFKFANITLIILPIALIVLFFLHWKTSSRSRNELLFFSPLLVLSIFVMLRITLLIPILKNVYPDTYLLFFIFFIAYFLFLIDWEKTSVLKKCFKALTFILPAAFIIISIIQTPWFIKPGPAGNELIHEILPQVDGSFYLYVESYENPYGFYSLGATDAFYGAIYSYGPIYLNLTTSSGFAYIQSSPKHWNNIKGLWAAIAKKDCENTIYLLYKTNTTDIITNTENCGFLESCGLFKKIKKEYFCLYQVR